MNETVGKVVAAKPDWRAFALAAFRFAWFYAGFMLAVLMGENARWVIERFGWGGHVAVMVTTAIACACLYVASRRSWLEVRVLVGQIARFLHLVGVGR